MITQTCVQLSVLAAAFNMPEQDLLAALRRCARFLPAAFKQVVCQP